MRVPTQNRVVLLALATLIAGLTSLWWWRALPRGAVGEPAEATLVAFALTPPAEFQPLSATREVFAHGVELERTAVAAPEGVLISRAPVTLRGVLTGVRERGSDLEIRIYARFDAQPREFAPFDALGLDPADPDAVAIASDLEALLASTAFDATPALEAKLAASRARLRTRAHHPSVDSDVQPHGITAQATRDGRFERDLTPLLVDMRAPPSGFDVSIRHPSFAPVSIFVPFRDRGSPVSAARLASDTPIVLEMRRELEPRCLLRGVARCFDAVCALQVEAWSLAGDALGAMVAECDVDPSDGAFQLSVPIDGRFAVAVFADGYLPQTRTVFTYDELELWLGTFSLDHGATFSGRVDLARHTFGGRTWVYLSRENPVFRRNRVGRHGNMWVRGNFEPETSAVMTDDVGRFTIQGLATGPYEMRIGIDRNWWTEMDPVVFVSVPDQNVQVRPLLAHIELRLDQGGHPASQRRLQISGLGRSSSSSAELVSDRSGRADLWLFPGEPYLVHVAQEHGTPWVYGKVTPWTRLEVLEEISMGFPSRR